MKIKTTEENIKNAMGETRMILEGDCIEVLKQFPDNYFHAVVTDPPYGLKFMNKGWDYSVPSTHIWLEVFRVLRPGGHVLSFGGTRTYHHMAMNIELAGFEIRDQLQWIYGSGFPKSLDVSKAIDKAAGAEREVTGKSPNWRPAKTKGGAGFDKDVGSGSVEINVTAPATDDAKTWQGWGTALKPANEPIVMARKPLEKGLTVAQNVLKWGTGALNIDAGRIEGPKPKGSGSASSFVKHKRLDYDAEAVATQGRWPANVLFDEAAAEVLDGQSGVLKTGGVGRIDNPVEKSNVGFTNKRTERWTAGDSGGASRFFYVAKASKSERNEGLEDTAPKKSQGARPNSADPSGKFPDHDHRERGGNNHPTVKPIKLMEYLIKLVTPPTGIVLDPFCGSGSTGVAAIRNGFGFIGIEREKEYVKIAEKRIETVA